MAIDTYGPTIQLPVSRQLLSAGEFGIPVRAAVIDLDSRLQNQEADQVITTGSVDSTGFQMATLHGILLHNGKVCICGIGINVTTTVVIGTTGNIADTLMITLPSALAPNQAWFGSIGNGVNSGEASIASNGQVILRSWTPSQNISSGTTLRISSMYSTTE